MNNNSICQIIRFDELVKKEHLASHIDAKCSLTYYITRAFDSNALFCKKKLRIQRLKITLFNDFRLSQIHHILILKEWI